MDALISKWRSDTDKSTWCLGCGEREPDIEGFLCQHCNVDADAMFYLMKLDEDRKYKFPDLPPGVYVIPPGLVS